MTSNPLSLPDTQQNQLRRRMNNLNRQGVTLSEYLSFGLMRELGDTLDKLKDIHLFGWEDDLIEEVEQFYQLERVEPNE